MQNIRGSELPENDLLLITKKIFIGMMVKEHKMVYEGVSKVDEANVDTSTFVESSNRWI
jgi:hypothetical protein